MVFPIHAEIIRGLSALPARSETFKMFRIKSESFRCVIQSQEIAINVFVPTTIAQKQECWLRVSNTSDEIKIINTETVKSSAIEDFDILKSNQTPRNDIRLNEPTQLLQSRIPNHAKEKQLPLCLEFSNIFHLKCDKPSVKKNYTQKLRVKDNTLVYVKNYKLPQSQKLEINSQVSKLL